MSSCSVGSLLMITSLAPQFLAINGKPAAGQTTSDDPIARNRSQCWASSVARRIASSGIACPNEMVAVLVVWAEEVALVGRVIVSALRHIHAISSERQCVVEL